MDKANRPLNKISGAAASGAEAELKTQMNAFLVGGGPWAEMHAAKDRIFQIINPYLQEGVQDHYHPALSATERRDLLLEGYGLISEFGNGPEFIVRCYFQSSDPEKHPLESGLPKKVGLLVNSFNTVSQIGHTEWAQELGFNTVNAEGILHQETKAEALKRCADEIEKWGEQNPTLLSKHDKTELASALHDYRHAYLNIQNHLIGLQVVLEKLPSLLNSPANDQRAL